MQFYSLWLLLWSNQCESIEDNKFRRCLWLSMLESDFWWHIHRKTWFVNNSLEIGCTLKDDQQIKLKFPTEIFHHLSRGGLGNAAQIPSWSQTSQQRDGSHTGFLHFILALLIRRWLSFLLVPTLDRENNDFWVFIRIFFKQWRSIYLNTEEKLPMTEMPPMAQLPDDLWPMFLADNWLDSLRLC